MPSASSSILTFAILAGGAATRLGGRDKGLELLDGRPLVAWLIEAIAGMAPFGADPDTGTVFADEIVIVANRNHGAYACHARTIGDLVPGFQGPLAGISAALAACTTPWLLTLPVDCPHPPSDLAARLLAGASQGRAAACVSHDGQRRQPLFAVYRRELADSAGAGLAAGQGVSWWQDSIGVNELDFADCRRQFRNLNTPEDFAAHAAAHRSAP